MDVADSIAAAVLRKLKESGHLLPLHIPSTSGHADHAVICRCTDAFAYYCGKPNGRDATAYSATVIEAVSDSDNDDVDAVLDGILGGESNTPIAIYNVVYRPLVLPQFRSYYSVGRAGRRWWKYIFW